MERARKSKTDIFWEIVEHCPVSHRWQRHVLLTIAKKQAETEMPVRVVPADLARSAFPEAWAETALQSLVQDGHVYANADGTYYVKHPRKTGRWRWEDGKSTAARPW